jgi:molecular chaperone GrpE
MSEKKHNKPIPDEAGETPAEAVQSAPEEAEEQGAGLAALQEKLAEAQARSAEYLDGWQRSQAEFSNYRKRLERDNEMTYGSMKADLIRKYLPVLDDVERALQNRPADSGPWVNGIELIQKKLSAILESEGVRRIEAEGQAFDPALHEAISHEPSDAVESGHVIAVTQNGYMLGDRVIRPALVRVAQ